MQQRVVESRAVQATLAVLLSAAVVCGALWSSESVAQTRPAIVKNVDEPGRTPWETRSQFLPNAGGCYGTSDCYNYSEGTGFALFDLRPVPAGKRWVVQSATGYFVSGKDRVINIELGYPRGGLVFDGTKWAFAGPFYQGTSFNAAIFRADVFAVFGPGDTPFVRVTATPSLSGYMVIAFSGYLIDAT